MKVKRRNRKEEILKAAVRLVADRGSEAATVRAIAREAGVTDAALYCHYDSKDELCRQAYNRIVEHMASEKRPLLESEAPFRERLREWIRLSFSYYDKNPEAVRFFMAMPLAAYSSGDSPVMGQTELMIELMRRAAEKGEIRDIKPEVAMSHLSGVILNVPRLINEGTLEGKVSDYVDEVVETAWRILRPEVE